MQVQVKTNVLAKNDAIAEALQQLFKEKNIFVFNLLGSPGAGKTSLLEATLQDLKKEYRLKAIYLRQRMPSAFMSWVCLLSRLIRLVGAISMHR